MTDEQREALIADYGQNMLAAHARGDIEQAKRWLDLEYQAIKQRSPEQKARMAEGQGLPA